MQPTEILPKKFIHVLPKKNKKNKPKKPRKPQTQIQKYPQNLDNQLIYTEIHNVRGHAKLH